jgi:hypothetical protein
MMAGVWIRRAAIILVPMVLGIGLVIPVRRTRLGRAITWQRQSSPGPLSAAHSFLENNCSACHRSVRGPESAQCIACHAKDIALLQRQPTAFHATIGSCRDCHFEHHGAGRHSTLMDHKALIRIALRPRRSVQRGTGDAEPRRKQLVSWIKQSDRTGGPASRGNPHLTSGEAALECAACHGTKDRHFQYFGRDCAECHRTTAWTIAEFRHPSPRNTECDQCHQPPSCHSMEHFHMVLAKVARQPTARVGQCFLCHQTTDWNDIKGVGCCMNH